MINILKHGTLNIYLCSIVYRIVRPYSLENQPVAGKHKPKQWMAQIANHTTTAKPNAAEETEGDMKEVDMEKTYNKVISQYSDVFTTEEHHRPIAIIINGVNVRMTPHQVAHSCWEDFTLGSSIYPEHVRAILREIRRRLRNRVGICINL